MLQQVSYPGCQGPETPKRSSLPICREKLPFPETPPVSFSSHPIVHLVYLSFPKSVTGPYAIDFRVRAGLDDGESVIVFPVEILHSFLAPLTNY
jgi:hypothetical protein